MESTDYDTVLRLTYLLSDNSFTFIKYNSTHTCISASKTEVPVINELESGELISCEIDEDKN